MNTSSVAKRLRAIVIALTVTFATNYAISVASESTPGNPVPKPVTVLTASESTPGNPVPKPVAGALESESTPGNPVPKP